MSPTVVRLTSSPTTRVWPARSSRSAARAVPVSSLCWVEPGLTPWAYIQSNGFNGVTPRISAKCHRPVGCEHYGRARASGSTRLHSAPPASMALRTSPSRRTTFLSRAATANLANASITAAGPVQNITVSDGNFHIIADQLGGNVTNGNALVSDTNTTGVPDRQRHLAHQPGRRHRPGWRRSGNRQAHHHRHQQRAADPSHRRHRGRQQRRLQRPRRHRNRRAG